MTTHHRAWHFYHILSVGMSYDWICFWKNLTTSYLLKNCLFSLCHDWKRGKPFAHRFFFFLKPLNGVVGVVCMRSSTNSPLAGIQRQLSFFSHLHMTPNLHIKIHQGTLCSFRFMITFWQIWTQFHQNIPSYYR